MDLIRTFIAIELPGPVKEGLRRLASSLDSEHLSFVKWVDPAAVHLTLKFLGNTDAARLPEIVAAMSEAAVGITPLHLELSGSGAFPSLKSPRVVWVGIKGDTAGLLKLQDSVEKKVSPLGFPTEERRFTPHLTLGRIRDRVSPEERRHLSEVISSLKAEDISPFVVYAVSFVRSELTRQGAVYSRLAAVELGKA